MSGSFPSLKQHVWLWQNFKLCHTGTHHVVFLCFSKDKSLELQYHLEQDKQELRPSYIISVNYLDLDQANATHEFQAQSKFLYQNGLIQNLGEFKVENQVLERNYNRATIHHFHCKRLSSQSIYLALKNKKTRHTFILFLSFFILDHTLLLYIKQR